MGRWAYCFSLRVITFWGKGTKGGNIFDVAEEIPDLAQ